MSELLLTAAQMRAWERAAIDSGAVTGLELMERAGVGAVDAILAEWPELAAAPGRAVVLCGPGNNGGDGFVVARVLAGLGWAVEVFLYGDAERLPPDARTNYERWCEVGEVAPLNRLVPEDHPTDIYVDALFGTGLRRRFDDQVWHRVQAEIEDRRDLPPWLVSLDVISGLDADSGREYGDSPDLSPADLTVAFGSAKIGHYVGNGPFLSGKLVVLNLELDDPSLVLDERRPRRSADEAKRSSLRGNGAKARVRDVRSSLVEAAPNVLKQGGHKYAHGHALILTGPFGHTGAARLSARATLRIGAGLVTVAAPGSAMMECATQLTAIMLRRCDDGDALAALLADDRLNALCLGPGLGTDDRAGGLVAAALGWGRACVLDADALTLIARDDALRAALHDGCVLTPHAGEFARLFPDIAARLDAPAETGPAYSKIDAAREAAARAGCTILLKGPDTVIADPDGRASVNAAVYERAAPWLATAGTGDVLAGMVAGLLARGLRPHDAAATAAWLHVEAARAFGPGLIAEDLPDMLPRVLRDLGA